MTNTNKKQTNSLENYMDINSFIGPWVCDIETNDGEVIRFGYEAPTQVEYPDRWDSEYEAHKESQDEMYSLESRCIKALADELKEERRLRLIRILRWIARADYKVLKRNRGIFWGRVKSSRERCSKLGCWYRVYLTKIQVDVVFAAFKHRLEGGKL